MDIFKLTYRFILNFTLACCVDIIFKSLYLFSKESQFSLLSLGFFLHKIEIMTARLNEINVYLEQPSLVVYIHFLLLPSKTGTFIQTEIHPQ